MRKQLRLWGMIPLILLGLAACDKDNATQDQGAGNVKITFGFDQTDTKAIEASDKKPTTSWTANIKDLVILFTKDGTVMDARKIDVPQAADISNKDVTLKNIPAADNYNIVIIANSGMATNIARPWAPENAKGKQLTALLMNLVTETLPAGWPGQGYKEPAEIFIASKTASIKPDIVNDISDPFALTRAVSLIRIRLIPRGDNLSKIDFTSAGKGQIYWRKVPVTMNAANGYSGRTDTKGICIKTPFLSIEPTNGYAGTKPIITGDVKYYKDFRSFPGGSATVGAEKFDIMITGSTKDATYTPAGAGSPVPANTPIYWSGPINQVIAANGILEVVITVESVGAPDEPEVGSYGNLSIKLNLVNWGNVTQYEMPV